MKLATSTKSQIAQAYKVSVPTLNKWLALIPNLGLNKNQRILTPKQVEIIFNHLGEPPD